jgi:hypothetical protein
MNYRVAKDNAISELIDPANITGASFGFCLSPTAFHNQTVNYLWLIHPRH